jgi:hypothetical protein
LNVRARNLLIGISALVLAVFTSAAALHAAPFNSLPQTVLNTASAVYGNGVGASAEQINSTSNALHVLVTGSSGTSSMNLAQWGGTTVTAGALLADNLTLPTTGIIGATCAGYDGTNLDLCRTGDVNNVASPTGYLDTLGVGRYNATLPTITDTRYNALQVGSRGSLNVTLLGSNSVAGADVASGGDGRTLNTNALVTDSRLALVNSTGASLDLARASAIGTGILVAAPPDYNYVHIAAGQATTVVKGSPGFLHAVCFNSAATATNVTTIYDNASTSGNVIAIPNAVAATVPNCITYDLKAALGIVIITGTANGSDMTVSYR